MCVCVCASISKVDIRLLATDGKVLRTPEGEHGERLDQFMSSPALLRIAIHEARGLPTNLTDYYVKYMASVSQKSSMLWRKCTGALTFEIFCQDLDQKVHKTRSTGTPLFFPSKVLSPVAFIVDFSKFVPGIASVASEKKNRKKIRALTFRNLCQASTTPSALITRTSSWSR